MSRPATGGLVRLVAADLPGHRLVRGPDGAATFVPEGGGPTLVVSERTEKRFLGRTEIARFRTVMPGPGWGPARLTARHTGRLRRQGVEFQVEEGSEQARELAEVIAANPEFAASASALDFTRFDLDLDGESCVATVELMGASLVSIAFPPIRSYVRLHPDQREALLGSLDALQRLTGE